MLKEELYTQSQVDAIEYLAKGFAKSEEQARIIKLLEAECDRPQDSKWEHYRESCYCGAIDLIKGEK